MSVFGSLSLFVTLWLLAEASNRNERVWPVGQSSSVDLPQSSPFGPRLQISQNRRYDFHRGVDIPIPIGTPLVAIDDGTVRIAGSHVSYSDGVVQIIHEGWDEDPESKFYVNYIHIMNATVTEDEHVVKGQVVAYSFRSDTPTSQFEHLHFEVRAGGLFQANCCNPWKYLPNVNNNYTSFDADIDLQPNYNSLNCEAVVNVSVPPNQLTMNRIELHVINSGVDSVRVFDFCEDNLDHTLIELDNPLFEENLYISPGLFSSRSYGRGENATYGFHFLNLTETASGVGTLRAVAYDVFGNRVETPTVQYTCTNTDNAVTTDVNNSATTDISDAATTDIGNAATTDIGDAATTMEQSGEETTSAAAQELGITIILLIIAIVAYLM